MNYSLLVIAGLLCLIGWRGSAQPRGASPASPRPGGVTRARPPAAERADFDKMRRAFEKAVNENDFDAVRPYIDRGFRGVSVTGTPLAGPESVKAFWVRVRQLLGPGAKYRLRLDPGDTSITGDTARASGTTQEEIILPDGQKLTYKSRWSVNMLRRDGRWFATQADVKADLRDRLTVAARVIASRIWQGGLNLGRVRLFNPDFDGDDGFRKPESVEQQSLSAKPKDGAGKP